MSGLRFDGVWKSYPRWDGQARTVRSMLSRRAPLLRARGERRWVLRDVSLAVPDGASCGVIGRNGAGKSTLLRIATGLSSPSRGSVARPDETASVLTLGEAFAPDLTGRENAITAAVVAGCSRKLARELAPAAIEFAEISDHADAPVRTYSDGMRLRLAFGVLAQLEPKALVIDEVIAVGDLAFHGKCMDWIRDLRSRGTTMLLASHDLRLIERECELAIWLEDGRVAAAGASAEVVGEYERAAQERAAAATPTGPRRNGDVGRERVGTREATIDGVELHGAHGQPLHGDPARIPAGGRLSVSLAVRGHDGPVNGPIAALVVRRDHDDQVCVDVNSRDDGVALGTLTDATIRLELDRLDLAPGRYWLDVGLYRADWEVVFDYWWHAVALEIGDRPTSTRGQLYPPRRWALQRAEAASR